MELTDLTFNETVTLTDDGAFRGVVFGRFVPDHPQLGTLILLVVVEAGQTGCRGIVPFPLAKLAQLPRRAR